MAGLFPNHLERQPEDVGGDVRSAPLLTEAREIEAGFSDGHLQFCWWRKAADPREQAGWEIRTSRHELGGKSLAGHGRLTAEPSPVASI